VADLARFESPVVKSYPAAGSSGSGGFGAGDSALGEQSALTLADLSSTAKTIVRAAPDTAAAQGLGVAFGGSRSAGDSLVCGQRPGEWVLLGSAGSNQAVIDGLDLAGFVSVIDYTHSRALFRLSGEAAASLLEKVCSLDFSDAMTPDGAVTSASLAGVTCDLVRHDLTPDSPAPDTASAATPHDTGVAGAQDETGGHAGNVDPDSARSYLILCDRSFGQYLFDVILDAGTEFAIQPRP